MSDKPISSADSKLLESWLRARSVCRGLPQPVSDNGGLRVDTHLKDELRRYVFAYPVDGLRELGETIVEPLIYLKLAGTGEQLMAQLPARWRLSTPRYLMSCDELADAAAPSLPSRYHLNIAINDYTAAVSVSDDNGVVVASGHAAECHGVFIYDRIEVNELHRRSGLGRAVMNALLRTRKSPHSKQVLVATEDGRALYTALGWVVCAPYSSASIPIPDQGKTD